MPKFQVLQRSSLSETSSKQSQFMSSVKQRGPSVKCTDRWPMVTRVVTKKQNMRSFLEMGVVCDMQLATSH